MPRFLIAALAVLTVTTTSFAQGMIAPTAGPITGTWVSGTRARSGRNGTGSIPRTPIGWDKINVFECHRCIFLFR